MAYVPTYSPTLRNVKGSELTWTELDRNFTLIADEFDLVQVETDILTNRVLNLEVATGVTGAIPQNLADLLDVTSTTPTAGQALVWNGTAWGPGNQNASAVTTSFDKLTGILSTSVQGATTATTNLDGRYARTVNGLTPDTNGNITLSLTATQTGTLASRPSSSTNGVVYIVSGDVPANNGKTFIWVQSGSTGAWFQVVSYDQAVNDTLYLNVAGDTMTGPLVLSGAPTLNLHATTKAYVDAGDATRQPLDATLTSLAGLDVTAGFVVQTGPDTFTKRVLAAGSGITIANNSGVGATSFSVSGLNTTHFDPLALITAAETIAANNNDTTIPTSAAVAAAIASMASGTDVNMQFFTSSGTYTPSAGFTKAIAIVTGGGGGGDGSSSTTKSSGSGGAGATVIGVINISSGAALPVTIGAGGGSSSTGPTAGSATSLGTLISASGAQVGGLGGTTGSGGLVIPGGDGSSIEMSNGGASFWGSGGKGDSTASQGRAYGSGGGSPDQPSSGSRSAGSGASGVVLILEFK